MMTALEKAEEQQRLRDRLLNDLRYALDDMLKAFDTFPERSESWDDKVESDPEFVSALQQVRKLQQKVADLPSFLVD